jgi:hypothetical protein
MAEGFRVKTEAHVVRILYLVIGIRCFAADKGRTRSCLSAKEHIIKQSALDTKQYKYSFRPKQKHIFLWDLENRERFDQLH